MPTFATDSETLHALAVRCGHLPPVEVGTVRAVDIVLLDGSDAWERLRTWRAGGVQTAAVVHTPLAPPKDRLRLEPLVLLRALTPEAFEVAVEGVTLGRPRGSVETAHGRIDLDRAQFQWREGAAVSLTTQECRLLAYLASRAGRLIPRDELQLQVWDHRKPVPTRAVDMAISRLRKKIEPEPRQSISLITERHVGYRLVLQEPQPTDDTTYIGHGALRQTLLAALLPGTLVVLVGPAGVGKSTTARRLAQDRGEHRTVDLAGVDDASAAAGVIAQQLGASVPDHGNALAAVLDQVACALLVLDHVDDLGSWLPTLQAELTDRAFAVLATSRERLEGTPCFSLPPLPAADAVRLLVSRARRSLLTLSPEEAGQLAARVDGLPLILELAVARLRDLGLSGLSEWLHEPGVLTLDALLEATWERLSPSARSLLVALSVFHGTFEHTDAAVAYGASPALPWLELIRHHLVAGEGPFRLLHTVRAFARSHDATEAETRLDCWLQHRCGQLPIRIRRVGAVPFFDDLARRRLDLEHALGRARSDEAVAALTAGLDALLAVYGDEEQRTSSIENGLARVTPGGLPHAQLIGLRGQLRLNRDRRTALVDLDTAVAALRQDDPERAGRLGLESARVARWLEGGEAAIARLEAGLELQDLEFDTRQRLRGQHLLHLAFTDRADLRTGALQALAIADELALHGALADAAKLVSGNTVRLLGLGDGRQAMEKRLAWTREIPDLREYGQSLVLLAIELGHDGDEEGSMHHFDEADAIFARVEPVRAFQVLQTRSATLLQFGRLNEARPGLQKYLAWCRSRNNTLGVADVLLTLAPMACVAGDLVAAEAYAEEAVTLSREISNAHFEAHATLDLALARQLAGGPDVSTLLDTIDAEKLSQIGCFELWAQQIALSAKAGAETSQLQAKFAEAARGEPSGFGRVAQQLMEAGLAGDHHRLRAFSKPGTHLPQPFQVAVHAAIWRHHNP